jgi:hypothetical protein
VSAKPIVPCPLKHLSTHHTLLSSINSHPDWFRTASAQLSATMDANDCTHSLLLSLPPEIRNIIYRYALVEDEIEIDPPMSPVPEQPSLLQTNRQVRAEASDIYYKENEFVWCIEDFNVEAFVAWSESSRATKRSTLVMRLDGKPTWANLVWWLGVYCTRKAQGLGFSEEDVHPMVTAAEQLFKLASNLAKKGLRWEEIKPNLELMREAFGNYDVEWLEG